MDISKDTARHVGITNDNTEASTILEDIKLEKQTILIDMFGDEWLCPIGPHYVSRATSGDPCRRCGRCSIHCFD